MLERDDDRPAEARAFRTQLADVFVHELSATRRDVSEADPDTPTVNVTSPAAVLSEDGSGFYVRWAVSVFIPADKTAVEIDCTVEGHFRSESGVDEDEFSSFKSRESFILLWPYVRAAVGEIARMLALDVPPLPTVDVRQFLGGGEPAEEGDSPDRKGPIEQTSE